MAAATRTKAVLAGFWALCLVALEGVILALVGFLLLLFTDPGLAAAAYRYGIDLGGDLLAGLGLLAAGYVAASRVEQRKVWTGALVAVVLLLISIGISAPIALLSEGTFGRELGTALWGWVAHLALPPLGALLQRQRGARGRPVELARLVGLASCYNVLLMGGLAAAGAFLIVGFYPGGWAPFAKWQMWLFASLLLLLPAYAVFLMRNRGGLMKRLLKAPAAWACVAAVVWFTFCFVRSEKANQWDPTEIRGLVTQINARDKIPDDQNGAALAVRAAEAIYDLKYPQGDRPAGVWDPQQHSAWSAYLDQAAEPMALARRAVLMPIFYRAQENGNGDHSGLIRWVTDAMILQARREDLGFDQSLGWLDDALRLAVPLKEAAQYGGVIAYGVGGVACSALLDLLGTKQPDAAQLRRADELLTEWEKAEKPDVEVECLAARLDVVNYARDIYGPKRDEKLMTFMAFHVFDRPYLARLARRKVESLCADLRSRPLYQVRLLHPRAPIFFWFGNSTGTDPFVKMDMVLASGIGSMTSYDIDGYFQAIAHMRILRAYIAADRMYAATGRMPSGWQDLVPTYLDRVPDDPFTGAPLVMRPAAGGVSFSSVGPDGKDAGGQGFFTGAEKQAAEKQGTQPGGIPPDLPDDIVLVFHPTGAQPAAPQAEPRQ